jgi:hypothetical protein
MSVLLDEHLSNLLIRSPDYKIREAAQPPQIFGKKSTSPRGFEPLLPGLRIFYVKIRR